MHQFTMYTFLWSDPLGVLRSFPVLTESDPSLCDAGNNPTGNAYADDGSGYQMFVINYTQVTAIYAPDGTQVYPSFKDTNGNYFSQDGSGNLIDPVGRTPVTVTSNCNGHSNQTCYNVLNSRGTRSTYTVTTETISVNTAFGQSGVTEYSGSITVIQSIQFPDNTTYQFTYDSGTTAGHYGELTSMTLPTGGQVTYGYTNFQDSYGNKNLWVNSRTSGGGTWSYTPQVIGSCPSVCRQQVIISKPSGDNSLYSHALQNNGAWVDLILYYNGAVSPSNQIASLSNTRDYSQSGALITKTITTLPTPGGNSISSQSTFTYANGFVTSIKAWKFYAGTFPTTADRETDFTYHVGFGNNILDRVTQTTVKNSSGSVMAQTNFSYDDSGGLSNSTPATGIFQHDDTNYGLSNTVRGNLTTTKRCTNLTNCTANYVQNSMVYDTTGQVLSAKDPNLNLTNLAYTDTGFYNDAGDGPSNPPQAYTASVHTNAYVKTVTPPITSLASTFGYYYGTGQRALATDANSQTTYSHFYDAFGRPTSAVLPDGGWSYSSYAPSETLADVYIGITAAFSTSGGAGIRQDEAALDNLARPITQKLMSDPDGITTVTTNFDTTGRVLNTSHPARSTSSSTDGTETPTYDGLGRVIKVTHQDTTYSQKLFGAAVTGSGVNTTQLCSSSTYGLAFPILAIDEAGKKREIWVDGFGRTIEADEPDSSGNLTSATCYLYDSLGNLLQIIHGSQTRTYAYDALSRPTSITIPELANASGTPCSVTYSYDSNSNVQTQVAPAPNQTTCTSTVTATYSYDALNRLTGKTYSDSTPAVKYGYDGVALSGCSTTPPALTDSNPKGRRTSMCDASGATSWAHDATGRILTEARTILGITKNISYSYNLDGSIATVTYPSAKVVTYTVKEAQRLTAAKDVTNNIQFATAASYSPPGGLNGMITGQISGGFGGITESHTYNNSLEYTSTQATSSAGTAMNLTMTYNTTGSDNGTVTGVTNNADTGRTQSFTYDQLNRILSAKSSATSGVDCWGQNFGPDGAAADDAVANLTKINSGTQTAPPCPLIMLNATVDANNHINSDSTYATDAAGNMTKDGSGTGYLYTFDAEGRLTLAAGPSGGPYCYVYDGLGRRVAKKSSATTCSSGTITKLYWRSISGDALAESDSTGSTTNAAYNEYVFFTGRRIASRNGTGTIFYYFADQLGSVRTITTGSGTGQTPGQLCYDQDYTPYGQEVFTTAQMSRLQTAACPTNYRFTGYERDQETGLDYAFARYYSSRLGRFLSTDPLGGSIGSLQSHNAYAYVVNNPLNFVDPLGLWCSAPQGDRDTPCNPSNSSGPDTSLSWLLGDEFSILDLALAPTGSHWELTPCDGGDGCKHGWTEVEVPDGFGNVSLLSLLGLGSDPSSGTTTGPCNNFKYSVGAAWHIFADHVAPGNEYNKSKYDVKDIHFDSDSKKMGAVLALNDYVFAHSTPQTQYNSQGQLWSYVYTVNVKQGTVFEGYPDTDPNSTSFLTPLITVNIVGTLAGKLGGGPTNDATLVLDPNCVVRTSFPGKPLKTP
jgi:RHS repeat-associated protein